MSLKRRLPLVLIAGSLVAQLLAIGPTQRAVAQPERPNVLLIITDDHRATGTFRVLPATRSWFVRRGREFPGAFTTTPLCCPARASIMTGQLAHNHGVRTNDAASTSNLDHDTTLQAYLDDAGYSTGLSGKFLNGWKLTSSPPHFDDWAMLRQGYFDARFNVGGDMRTVNRYSTDFIAGWAKRFITAGEDQDSRPWLLYVAPFAPHLPARAEREYADAPVGRWRGTPGFFERDRRDKPPYIRRTNRLSDPAELLARAKQLRSLMSVDDLVLSLMRTLRRTGELEDTLAVFVADNGFLWKEHGFQGKAVPYTESIRVPMFARWPAEGWTGGRDRRLVTSGDIAPTVLDAAGVPSGHLIDSRSLLDDSWTREVVLGEHVRTWPETSVPSWASLRTKRFLYVEYYGSGGAVTFREYYNVRDDPAQLVNLFRDGRPSNDPDSALLSARLAEAASCAGTSGPDGCP